MNASLAGLIPGIIDTHIHQWDPFTTPREASKFAPLIRRAPWLAQNVLPRLIARQDRELVLTPMHVGTPYLPTTYAADVAAAVEAVGVPVGAAVHVQAGWHGDDQVDETTWVQALPFGRDGHPPLVAIVANADPTASDFAKVLDRHLAASEAVRGIRTITAHHPDPKVKDWIDRPGVLAEPAFLTGFAALAERGLTFDSWIYSHQLGDLRALAGEYPETTIVLDHFATPVGLLGPMGRATGRTPSDRGELMARWRDDLAALAAHPNVVAKQSGIAFPPLGLQRPGLGRAELAELAAPLIEHTADVFGPDRMLFGSNFPMDKAVSDYGSVVGAVADVLEPRGPETLRKVFRENAVRVYRL
jgi:predicted TIM-barrel fold metal-dependent hydrolase